MEASNQDAAELPLNLNVADDGEILREFITESREHLDQIEEAILTLEGSPDDAEILNRIFRAFHTLKGGAGFLNLAPINRLGHAIESLLDLARQKRININRSFTEVVLRGRDTMCQFLTEIEEQVTGQRDSAPILIPTAELIAEAKALAASASSDGSTVEKSDEVDSSPENSEKKETGSAISATPARKTKQADTVKVDTARLDSLLDLVGEMVVAQSLVAEHLLGLGEINPHLARDLAHVGRITKELQRLSTSMRMTPIAGLFQKMARVVRDVGTKQDKPVRLAISGEDTELDRSVVEELSDPLLHMIRNAMDHGIEPPEVRAELGKAAVGTIHLRACHQGGGIVIGVSDDGAGLNKERILARAIERGLTSAEAIHTDQEIYNFIFAPGFSTADEVTELSGRGVGLDVVHRNITRLRGQVYITSSPGVGAMFKITLPLTLAIIDGLVVKVGAERYIIPALSVRESFRPLAGAITKIQGRAEMVNVRGQIVPLLRLHEYFGIPGAIEDPLKGILVLAQTGDRYQCLLVDSLLQKQEVVIKNLGELMVGKNRDLAGATILGDGRVGLILDVNSLAQQDRPPISEAA